MNNDFCAFCSHHSNALYEETKLNHSEPPVENFHHSGKEEEKILAKLYALTKMMISWMILYKVQHYTFYLTFCGWKRAYTWEKSLAKKLQTVLSYQGCTTCGSLAAGLWKNGERIRTSPKIGPSRCARFVFVILCSTL